ncbi:hypothetical protein DXG01_010088 [Tephrocybe rancida]|nr:hypothetical protein DXG01_010088 [Tephrocybe rancida]
MGLSGRKVKQRIPADPRNLAWADDAAKFGSNYLSKFGWDASKGLGVDGDGRTSHIKVSHKLDMLGIGAAHQRDPDGIAWKQNKDFESLLKRLNENIPADATPLSIAVEIKEEVLDEEVESRTDESGTEKKRKRKKDRESKSEGKAKKRRKKDTEDGAKGVEDTKGLDATIPLEDSKPSAPSKPFVPRNRAHRARAIASKAIASKSSAHIAEILGIAPTPSTSSVASGSGTPLGGKLTPLDDDTITLEKLTTSTKSVADYFKEKLLAKSFKSGTQTPTTPLPEAVNQEEPYDAPRGGLGASRMGLGVKAETPDTETQRIGLSKFSSLMSSAFLSATTMLSSEPSTGESTPLGPDSSSKIKKEKRNKASTEDGKDEAAREIRKREKKEKKEKKRRRGGGKGEEGEVMEDVDGQSSEADRKSREKKEKRRKDTGVEEEAAVTEAITLSKEERRRLRKEKKNSKESNP